MRREGPRVCWDLGIGALQEGAMEGEIFLNMDALALGPPS